MHWLNRWFFGTLASLLFVMAVAPCPGSLDRLAFVSTALADETPLAEPAAEPEEPKVTAAPPAKALTSARATMEHFMKSANASHWEEAAKCLVLKPSQDGKALADRLKWVLDRIEFKVEDISDLPDAWRHCIETGDFERPIVIDRDKNGTWRFTGNTVASIDALYEFLKDEDPIAGRNWLRDLFPNWMTRPGFLLPYYQWVCLLVVIFAGIIVDQTLRFILWRMTCAWFRYRKIDADEKLERGLWKPLGLLVRALVWYGGMVVIGLRPDVLQILKVAVEFCAIVSAVWTAFRFIDLLSSYLARKAQATDTKFDDLIVPLVSRSLKVFVVCIGVVTFAQMFDLPIAGLLGGMGLGGVAVAFAAKDTVGNVFGSVTVLVDRPFEIGDWIVTDKVEGTVETVGIRSTRVRTFYNSLVTLPNSLLTTTVVDNMGRRRYRRIKTMLSLQYDTPPERIEAFCEGVRELLRRHPYTRKDYYHVYLNQFSASSLDVLLYCFVECPDWGIELRERQRLFLDILRLAEELGVSFAFPTQTLHMFQEEHVAGSSAPLSDPLATGRRLAARVAGPVQVADLRPGPVEYRGPSSDDDESGDGGGDA